MNEFPKIIRDLISALIKEQILNAVPFQVSINVYDNPSQGMIVKNLKYHSNTIRRTKMDSETELSLLV